MVATEKFSIEQSEGITIIRVSDTTLFDTDDYAELQRQLVEYVERSQSLNLAVDLSRVQYCSTALTNTLLMAQKRAEASGGKMRLFGLSEVVLETLDRLKLANSFFAIYPDEAAALAAF